VLITRRITAGRAAPMMAALAVSAFPDVRWHAVDARGYAIATSLVMLTVFLSTTPELGSTRLRVRVLSIGIPMGVAATFNIFVLFAFVPFALAIMTTSGRVRNLGRLVLAGIITLAFLIPFVPPYLKIQGGDFWIQPIPFEDWLQSVSNQPGWLDRSLTALAVLLVITGILGAFRGDWIGRGPNAPSGNIVVLFGLMGFLPLLLLAVFAELRQPAIVPRYVGYSLPFLVAGVVLLAHPWWSRATHWAVLRVGVVGLALIAVSWSLWAPFIQRPLQDEYRAASAYVISNAGPDDVIIATSVPSVLERYGVELERRASGQTRRLWTIGYGGASLEYLTQRAEELGLVVTGATPAEERFGSAAVVSIEVTPEP